MWVALATTGMMAILAVALIAAGEMLPKPKPPAETAEPQPWWVWAVTVALGLGLMAIGSAVLRGVRERGCVVTLPGGHATGLVIFGLALVAFIGAIVVAKRAQARDAAAWQGSAGGYLVAATMLAGVLVAIMAGAALGLCSVRADTSFAISRETAGLPAAATDYAKQPAGASREFGRAFGVFLYRVEAAADLAVDPQVWQPAGTEARGRLSRSVVAVGTAISTTAVWAAVSVLGILYLLIRFGFDRWAARTRWRVWLRRPLVLLAVGWFVPAVGLGAAAHGAALLAPDSVLGFAAVGVAASLALTLWMGLSWRGGNAIAASGSA